MPWLALPTFLTAAVFAQLPQYVSAIDGTAQMTGGNLDGGTCMFNNYTFPPNIYGAALAGPNWQSGGMCGACLTVDGERGSVVAMVVDECPGCKNNQINLFQDAFSKVGDPSKGTINVRWDVVYCGINTPIILRNKTGSSKYWFEMQVLNSNQPISSLEVSVDNGNTWQSTVRKDYNYFQKAGGGGGFERDSVWIRLKCLDGRTVIAPDIGVKGDTQYSTSVNC